MVWYYKVGDQENGPVSKSELQSLIKSNSLSAQSMVRNVEMDDWYPLIDVIRGKTPQTPTPQPPAADDAFLQDMEAVEASTGDGLDSLSMEEKPELSSVEDQARDLMAAGSAGTDGAAVCSQCGRSFPADQVISFEDRLICAACKPMFVQKLKEGAALPSGDVYAGFLVRVLAKVIDTAIMVAGLSVLILLPMFAVIIPMFVRGASDAAGTAVVVAVIAYFAALVLAMVLPLAYNTIFLGRSGATIGKKACGIKVVTAEGDAISYKRAFGRCLAEWISGTIFCIGYILAAFNDEKKTLHDSICSTRVIKTK